MPPSILHEYPSAAGFPNDIICSGVATLECRKPVSSNLPSCGARAAVKGEAGLSRDTGDMISSLLKLFRWYSLSMDDVFLWPRDGATTLGLTFSADEGLWALGIEITSTVSVKEILRSVQAGGEAVLSLTGLALWSWQLSTSLVFGSSEENSQLFVSVEQS